MNNNNLSVITEQQTITSMEIASITYKNHSDVLRAIRKMEPAWEAEHKSKFALKFRISNLGNGATKKNPYYELTRIECLFVATKFNDEARAKLVLRWEQLEKERLQSQPANTVQPANPRNLPADPSQLTRKQILLLAIEAEEENERLRAEKQELEMENYSLMIEQGEKNHQIEQLEKQTAYLRVIMSDTTSMTITQIAQDYGLSAVAMNNLLKGLQVQRKVGDQWILYADYLGKGYVATRMIPIHHAGRDDTFKPMTVWTQLGRRFIYDRLKKHGIFPLIERMQAKEGGTQ